MKSFSGILYVSEPSVAEEASLARAVSLAENNQADLMVVGVVPAVTAGMDMPSGGPSTGELREAMAQACRERLAALIAPHAARIDIRLDVHVGKVFVEAIRAVFRHDCDLLMKPAENPDFIARLFGSDDMQLLRNCPCPVWLTRAEEASNYASIMAAVDFSPDAPDDENHSLNERILELSSSLALSDFSALHFVHVWDAPGEILVSSWSDDPREASMAYVEGIRSTHENALRRFRDRLKEAIGAEAYDHVSPQFHLRRGMASRVIPDMARELQADLVVMGTVARTGVAGLLIGNTAEAILEQVQCSVLAVKPDDFVSPVK